MVDIKVKMKQFIRKSKISAGLLFFIILAVLARAHASGSKSRIIDFDYAVEIKDVPAGVYDLKVWLPQAPQTLYQAIESISIDPKGTARLTYDRAYRNKIIHYSFKTLKGPIKINAQYKIKRYEYSKTRGNPDENPGQESGLAKYLASNKLMVVDDEIKKMAQDITKGKNTDMEKARAIYDYVLENVSYDKTIPGWGAGDTKRVCLIKAGNCSDFHSLFVSLARASGIPAKFIMGVSIPKEKGGEIKNYHCWAEFYDRESGWIPVDISEAWKDKSKKDYYFGSIDENRIEISEGRDIALEPPAKAGPLNYFIYPHVEINGENFQNLNVSFRFKDGSMKGGGIIR